MLSLLASVAMTSAVSDVGSAPLALNCTLREMALDINLGLPNASGWVHTVCVDDAGKIFDLAGGDAMTIDALNPLRPSPSPQKVVLPSGETIEVRPSKEEEDEW